MNKAKILVAFATMTCALAASASPALAHFHASAYPAKIHAQNKQIEKFVTAGGVLFECGTVHYYSDGPLAADTNQVKVQPEYIPKSCTAKALGAEGKEIVVKNGNCQFNFHLVTQPAAAGGEGKGNVTIECPSGKEIEINSGILGCIITVGNQTSTGNPIIYQNQAVKPVTTDVTANITIKSGKVNLACELGGLKGGETVTYSGAATVSGQKTATGEAVDVETVV